MSNVCSNNAKSSLYETLTELDFWRQKLAAPAAFLAHGCWAGMLREEPTVWMGCILSDTREPFYTKLNSQHGPPAAAIPFKDAVCMVVVDIKLNLLKKKKKKTIKLFCFYS